MGLGTRFPPTYVGARDLRPTAFSAPRSCFEGCERFDDDPRRSQGLFAPKRALASPRALDAGVRRAFSARLVDEGMRLARLWNPGVVSAFYPIGDEPDTLALLRALADEGFTTALPVTVTRATARRSVDGARARRRFPVR